MISLIAALSENRVIGKDNRVPWRIPADLQRLKSLTLGNTVILGRILSFIFFAKISLRDFQKL